MIIECNEVINKEYVKKHNIKPVRDLIVIKNTANQSSENIRSIDPNIQIRVIGGYDSDVDSRYDDKKYHDRNTFSAFELAEIISRFERIEEGIEPNWSTLKKSFYLYNRLRNYMRYDEASLEMIYDVDGDFETLRNIVSSIRGIIDKKALCAGISLIFKELEERQGINCKFRVNQGEHAWNEIDVYGDGKYYPVDLTGDIIRREKGKKSLCYFLNNPRFYEQKKHKANDKNGKTVSRIIPTAILKREVLDLLSFDLDMADEKEIEEEVRG